MLVRGLIPIALWFVAVAAVARPQVAWLGYSASAEAGPTGTEVWLVSDCATSQRLYVHHRLGGAGTLGRGSSEPLLSPDGDVVASAYRDTLFIFDVDAREEHVAFVSPREHHVLLTDWSSDGRSLLFYVSAPMYVCRHEPFDPVTPDPGYRLYHRRTGVVTRDFVPDSLSVFAWLNDGLLVQRGLGRPMELFSPATHRLSQTAVPGNFGQAWVGDDGRSVYATKWWPMPRELIRVDLVTHAVTVLGRSDDEDVMEYQFPRTSPGGAHLAYKVLAWDPLSEVPRSQSSGLVVDGELRWIWGSWFRYKWLSDSTIVVMTGSDLRIIDAESGRNLCVFGGEGQPTDEGANGP